MEEWRDTYILLLVNLSMGYSSFDSGATCKGIVLLVLSSPSLPPPSPFAINSTHFFSTPLTFLHLPSHSPSPFLPLLFHLPFHLSSHTPSNPSPLLIILLPPLALSPLLPIFFPLFQLILPPSCYPHSHPPPTPLSFQQESLRVQEFYLQVEEEEAWIREKEPLASSADFGKDRISVVQLQQKHQALEAEIQG